MNKKVLFIVAMVLMLAINACTGQKPAEVGDSVPEESNQNDVHEQAEHEGEGDELMHSPPIGLRRDHRAIRSDQHRRDSELL